ncbi:MAG: TetR/AcrR family transcriptional regulator [Gemmatimonadetes bacterium]|nr:TetR/AcrR family transcriptional regulator [Gemmatimonadota bacterium]
MASRARQEKERQILDAAVTVFARSGYHKSSIAAIAGEAGVAAGTIYLYFRQKEDLIIALFQRHLGDYLDEYEPRIRSESDPAVRIRRLIEYHLAFFEHDPELAVVFQIHLREVSPMIRDGITPVLVRYFDLIDDILQDAHGRGFLDPELDLRLARKVLFGALDEIVTSWARAEHRYSLLAQVDPLYRILSRAIGLKGEAECATG